MYRLLGGFREEQKQRERSGNPSDVLQLNLEIPRFFFRRQTMLKEHMG